MERRCVVGFQAAGPAAIRTAPAVALEDGTTDPVPAAAVQGGMESTSRLEVQTGHLIDSAIWKLRARGFFADGNV